MPAKVLLQANNESPGHQSKHAVSKRLRELAFKRGPDFKLPTTRELCELLDTSARTLNDAMEELELQNVIYRKPRSGIFVSQRLYQKNIALLMGSCVFENPNRSPFWDVLWGYFIREAQRRNHALGETFSIHAVLRKESAARPLDEQLARMIERRQIDGVLAVGMDAETCTWMRGYDLPIVSFAGNGVWIVAASMEELVRLGAEALIEQGCRDIRLWIAAENHPPESDQEGFSDWDENADAERKGFRSVLSKHGLPFNAGAVLNNKRGARCIDSRQDQGARAVAEMLAADGGRLPDGLLILDDMMTVGAIKALWEHGIRPGADIKIASHANKGIPVLDVFSDTITRIEVDPEAIVHTMFETLDTALSGGEPSDWVVMIAPFQVLTPKAG